MSTSSDTALIQRRSFDTISEVENSVNSNADNRNSPNVQSVVLDKLLADPDMQEVVVMEVSISNWVT